MKEITIFKRKVPFITILIALLVIGTASAALIQHYALMEGDVTINSPITVSVNGTQVDLGEPHTLVIDAMSTPCTISETLEFNNIHGSPVEVSLFWILYEAGETYPDLNTSTSYWIYNTTTLSIPTDGLTREVSLDIPSYMVGNHKFRIEVNPVF